MIKLYSKINCGLGPNGGVGTVSNSSGLSSGFYKFCWCLQNKYALCQKCR